MQACDGASIRAEGRRTTSRSFKKHPFGHRGTRRKGLKVEANRLFRSRSRSWDDIPQGGAYRKDPAFNEALNELGCTAPTWDEFWRRCVEQDPNANKKVARREWLRTYRGK